MTPDAKVTIATSTGMVWLGLLIHFGAGLVALASGFIALAVAKGGSWHRQTGLAFVICMIGLGVSAAGVAMHEGKVESIVAGILTTYLVFSGFIALRAMPQPRQRQLNLGIAVVGAALTAIQLPAALGALQEPARVKDGVPNGMTLFIFTITLLAAIGDWRVLRAGSLRGSRRLARHLWRMCFSLFIASGSFFLGQMKFLPEPVRILPLVGVLAIAPLPILLYWLWRVRIRQSLRGMIMHATNG